MDGATKGRSYNSNQGYAMISQQMVKAPGTSTSSGYNSNYPQNYIDDSQSYNSGHTRNYQNTYPINYTGYDMNYPQISDNNGGYLISSSNNFDTDQNSQKYGSEFQKESPQNYDLAYTSQDFGSYSSNINGNNAQNYVLGNTHSATYPQNYPVNYKTNYPQIYSNEQFSQNYYSKPSPSVNQFTSVQNRFHPTTYEEDSHTGEVIEPSATLQIFPPQDTVAQASDPVGVQDPVPATYQITPPPLPSGYDYHPAPPPLPPPPPVQGSPYFYPPAGPPTNQYLPVPTAPPPLDTDTKERQVDYTYYYLGPKLWYVPLFFSIYFVLYVGALIIKAISRHKILFPQHLYNAATSVYSGRGATSTQALDLMTARITQALTKAAAKYIKRRTIGSP